MRVIWAPRALARVEEIADWIARDNPEAARQWVEDVFNRVAQLRTFPHSGPMVPEVRREGVRELVLGRYRIIYRVDQKRLVVLTVRHGRQRPLGPPPAQE